MKILPLLRPLCWHGKPNFATVCSRLSPSPSLLSTRICGTATRICNPDPSQASHAQRGIMRPTRITGVIMLALMAAPIGLKAQKTVLVELFTSEGCSSCPPADALLRQVNGSQTSDGQLIVGISEHVTYWNSLGWTDPYSSPAYTDRQDAYSERFHLEGPYTPQMVINGAEQIVGSDRGALLQAVEKEDAESPRLSLRIVSVNVAGNTLTVNFATSGDVPKEGADLMAVLADDSDRSNVLRGE